MTKIKERKQNALERLKLQLESGTKTEKRSDNKKVTLTPKDINRIQREMEILKERI